MKMGTAYSPKDIEKKWQEIWDAEGAFKVGDRKSTRLNSSHL